MTTAIKRRRGTTAQHATFTGLEGEITVDTTKDTVVVHDGLVAGGHPLAKEKDPTFTGTVTLTGGTANGVAYLNGSKVLTTGSALTFDGALLDVGVGNTYGTINAKRYGAAPYATVTLTDPSNSANEVGVYFRANGTNPVGLSTAGAPMAFYLGGPGVSEQMRLTSTGLGIGTSSPSYKLDVTGSFRVWGGALASSVTPTNYIASENSSDAVALEVRQGRYNKDALVVSSNQALSANLLRLHENGTDRMVVTGSGNLGLGVTPSAWYSLFKTIDIGQGTSLTGQTNTPSTILATNTFWNSGATPIYKSTAAASYYASYGGQHLWYTAPSGTAGNAISFTQAMTLDASGNLGIGTSSPELKLDVAGDILINNNSYLYGENSVGGNSKLIGRASDDTLYVGDSAYNNPTVIQTGSNYVGIHTNGSERMRIDSAGNVLVGASTIDSTSAANCYIAPGYGYWYRPVTTAQAVFNFRNPNGYVGSIITDGSSTSYNTSSDYRLKENIQPMQNALAVVQQLNPVTYTWKADGSDGQGFIAHELQAVVPDCVTGEKDAVDKDGKPVYQGIDTSFLVATLCKAIQELTARVAQLEGK